jgi:hypothetical protein
MQLEKCPNCGAVDLEEMSDARWRCRYCKAFLRRAPEPHSLEVHVGPHVNIKILPTANIIVQQHVSKLVIDEGAEIEVAGKIVVKEPEPKE